MLSDLLSERKSIGLVPV